MELQIRNLKKEDFDEKLMPVINEFYNSSKYLKNFNKEHCFKTWKMILENKIGFGFLLIEKENPVGIICGLKYNDINSGELTVTEAAWFVKKSCRRKGLILLKKFEEEAKRGNCKSIIMVHLLDSMPDKLQKIYKRMGYEPIEVHYKKEF
jgi:GNAT superfamily N-acetyltransferase